MVALPARIFLFFIYCPLVLSQNSLCSCFIVTLPAGILALLCIALLGIREAHKIVLSSQSTLFRMSGSQNLLTFLYSVLSHGYYNSQYLRPFWYSCWLTWCYLCFFMVGKREAHKIVFSSRSTLFRISGSHNFDQTLKLGSWKHLEKI